jgi:hypothetical protein
MAKTPYLEEYLATLPDGLSSFPQARLRGEILDFVMDWLQEIEEPLPAVLRDPVRYYRPFGRAAKWVPEVLECAISLHIATVGYPTGQSWLDEVYRRQRKVYQTPLYRALLIMLSPTLLTMVATERWRAFRKGSELKMDRWTTTPTGRFTTATLRYPPGLHTELTLRSLGEMMVAAIDSCGAKETKYELTEEIKGEARFSMSYVA